MAPDHLDTTQVLQALRGLSAVSHAEVAAIALLAYEWALTIDMEINFIWKKKWNTVKVIYLIQRYTIIVDGCLLPLYRQLGRNLSDDQCSHLLTSLAVIMALGTLMSEVILTLRVWAIWNRDKRLLSFLMLAASVIWISTIVSGYWILAKVKYSAVPPYLGFRGCFIIKSTRWIASWWIALCVWDCLCMLLVIRPSLQFFLSGVSSRLPLSRVIYRDGVIFYIFLFCFSVFNVISNLTLPISQRVVASSLTRCLHSLLASRALLQMREQLQLQLQDDTTDFCSSAVRFDNRTTESARSGEAGRHWHSDRISIEIS